MKRKTVHHKVSHPKSILDTKLTTRHLKLDPAEFLLLLVVVIALLVILGWQLNVLPDIFGTASVLGASTLR